MSSDDIFVIAERPAAEPDSRATDHKVHLKAKTPIVIDHGSETWRVGWASEESPRLRFPPLAGKNRQKNAPMYAGNDALYHIKGRNLTRPNNENGLVVSWETEELLLDHAFSCLGIKETSVAHPIFVTEPLCNPALLRARLSELLFELYGAPSVGYGLDGLCSFYYNRPDARAGLVANLGYSGTTLLPVYDQRLQARKARRIDVGGAHIQTYGRAILGARHPHLVPELNSNVIETIVHRFSRVAPNYKDTLRQLEDPAHVTELLQRFQLPVDLSTIPTQEQLDERARKREVAAQRMRDMQLRRAESLLAGKDQKLQEGLDLMGTLAAAQPEDRAEILTQAGYSSDQAFANELETVDFQGSKLRARVQQVEPDFRPPVFYSEDDQALLDAESDETLTEQQKARRIEVQYIHGLQLLVDDARANRIAAGKDMPDENKQDTPLTIEEIEKVQAEVDSLRADRDRRKKMRSELRDRRSEAAKKQMRLLVQQSEGTKPNKRSRTMRGAKPTRNKETEDDDFGADDEDWAVYARINQKHTGDEEAEMDERIMTLEAQLEDMRTQYAREHPETREQMIESARLALQFALAVERVQIPEAIFEPPIAGIDQSGLIDGMGFVFGDSEPDMASAMAENVFLTGGMSKFAGMAERVQTELTSLRPFRSVVKVWTAQDPDDDAFRGACRLMRQVPDKVCMTKAEYEEYGPDYLKEHMASNMYIPNLTLQ